MNMIGKYLVNNLMALDVLANTLTFGMVETISSRIGKLKRDGKLDKHPIYKGIDSMLEQIDEYHSIEAIDEDAKGYEIKIRIPGGKIREIRTINDRNDYSDTAD